jgi:hypothetical protein
MKKTISMVPFAIYAIVQTTEEEINSHIAMFKKTPESSFMNGKGSEAYYIYLVNYLKKEDEFFNHSPMMPRIYPERWTDFMNDCVELTALNNFLFGYSIAFVD